MAIARPASPVVRPFAAVALVAAVALALVLVPVHAALAAGDEDRALATLNTLTTSCNGACKTNAACIVLGQSSENPINCVSDANCVTLLSGKAALCLQPFAADAGAWVFTPAKTNAAAGAAPFERVGLVQVTSSVRSVNFKVAASALTPLTKLDVSSLNVQSSSTLEKISFSDLTLSGLDGAMPLNGALGVAITNCQLQTIPTQFVTGSKLTALDLSGNAIASLSAEFLNQSFPTLQSLVLSNNQLREFPLVVFNLSSLQLLALDSNPLRTPAFTAEQFTFLSKVASLKLSNATGAIETDVCPSQDVIEKLGAYFTFCNSSHSGSGSGGAVVLKPTVAPASPTSVSPAAQTGENAGDSSSSSSTWIVLGTVAGGVVLLVIAFLLYRKKRQREESPKLANSAMPSIAIGMGDLADHPYMELNAPSSCSQTTSDFELLANVADGYIALTRLSYNDVFLHRMIRVSSRSELWFGEFMDESVIIKKMKSNAASKAVLREFVTEIEHMAELSHARIAAFKGAMWDNEGTELCAVVEFVENGALRDCVASAVGLSAAQQLAIARQVVDAMSFLHQKRIVHGRLNSFNVLLDKHFGAKLSMFSIFHYVKLSPLDFECGVFAAPEVLRGGQSTDKSDVYSLGVVLVELDTGENPVINARRSLTNGASPPHGFRLSATCSPIMREVVAACLERDPARRPTMAEVAVALKTGAFM
ncbi:hypothetical protein PybrP1_011728 [[Pythium] brassicae (nom. inval.)]|nr:hypothetical protein PybrP1_011728 [[Pythium] brassicae (nom. inval.)]